jgi:hypothetical protein
MNRVIVVVAVVVALAGVAFFASRRAAPATAPDDKRIADDDRARRLARAIAADIALYNAEDCDRARASGVPTAALTAAVDEGRRLFQERVTPKLHGLYDVAVDEVVLQRASR